MRIVHDIEGKTQVSFGGSLYSRPLDKPEYPGYFKVTGVIVVEDPFGEEEVIHIEGNSKYIIEALEDALDQMKSIDQMYQEEEKLSREKQNETTIQEDS